MTTILLAALAATIGLAAYMIRQRDRTIQALKGEVIIRTLATREARRERDADRQTLTDTECALGLAKEVLAERDVPQWEIDLLTGVATGDEATPLYEATKEHEAQVLEFRKHIPNDLGGAS